MIVTIAIYKQNPYQYRELADTRKMQDSSQNHLKHIDVKVTERLKHVKKPNCELLELKQVYLDETLQVGLYVCSGFYFLQN